MLDRDYDFNLAATRQTLWELAATYPLLPGLVYTSAYEFLALHGTDFRPSPWQCRYWNGPQKMCYGNAIVAGAFYGLHYVEGVALSPTGEAIPHAWNVDDQGELVDATWRNSGLVYIGVEFSLERADDATWNGDACVLDDLYRNYPVYQKRWKGEDYNLQWPPSDRLDTLRLPNPTMPPSCQEWIKAKEQNAG